MFKTHENTGRRVINLFGKDARENSGWMTAFRVPVLTDTNWQPLKPCFGSQGPRGLAACRGTQPDGAALPLFLRPRPRRTITWLALKRQGRVHRFSSVRNLKSKQTVVC